MKELNSMDLSACIMDTSAIMALFLHEEHGDEIEQKIYSILSNNGQIFVPSLFWYEVGNTISTAFRRDRLTLDDVQGIEYDISELPIVTDTIPDAAIRVRIREIALEHKLSLYDAAYIELSRRLQIELISLDKQIHSIISK